MNTLEQKRHFDSIVQRIERARIRVSEHHIVKIVAASKYVNADAVRGLYSIGQRAFGENKVQDLKFKADLLDELPLEWHFIGTLQKNKINQLLAVRPHMIHSIDTLDLAHALQERLLRENQTLRALIQINSANEASKSGFTPQEFLDHYAQIEHECPNLHLQGIMSIGAHSDDIKMVQKSFEITRTLFDKLPNATTCSMGMSSDFELAIQCGSNLVRLGSILFKQS